MRRLALGVHRALTLLLPRRIRLRRGVDIGLTFERLLEERKGLLETSKLLAGETADITRTALGYRLRRTGTGPAGGSWARFVLETVPFELRVASRNLCADKTFVAGSVVLLWLALSVNLTLFDWVDNQFLRPPPGIDQPDRVVVIQGHRPEGGGRFLAFQDLADLSETIAGLVEVGGESSWFPVLVARGPKGPEDVNGVGISSGYLEALGVAPRIGRSFSQEDDRYAAPPTVIVSQRFWERQFDADPDAIGRIVWWNERAHTLIGVMPEGFLGTFFSSQIDVWIPAHQWFAIFDSTRPARTAPPFPRLFARLRPGASRRDLAAELAGLARGLADEHPELWSDRGFKVLTLAESQDELGDSAWYKTMGGAGSFILAIGCANIAGLMLARSARRRRSLVLRRALGASRARLVLGALAESLLLGLAAGGFSLLLQPWVSTAGQALLGPMQLIAGVDLTVDARTVLVSFILPLLAAMFIGGLVAWRGTRAAMVEGPQLPSSPITPRRGSWALVTLQVALASCLVLASMLFGRSYLSLLHTEAELDVEHLVSARVRLDAAGYDERTAEAFMAQLDARLSSEPAFEGWGIGAGDYFSPAWMFLGGAVSSVGVEDSAPTSVHWEVADRGFFEALRLELLQGRLFDESEAEGESAVAVIDDSLAAALPGGGNVIGQALRIDSCPKLERDYEIVGVVKGWTSDPTESAPLPRIWIAGGRRTLLECGPAHGFGIVVRTRGSARASIADLSRVVSDIDPDVAITQVSWLADDYSQTMAAPRSHALLAACAALIGIVLALVGLYATLTSRIAGSLAEIGVRMAVGASPSDVIGATTRVAMIPVAWGAAAGILVGWLVVTALAFRYHGISASDPTSYLATLLLVVTAAALTSLWPARRAARTDPAVVLRSE